MTSISFAVLTILLAASIDAKDPECPDPSYVGPSVFVPDYYDCHWYYECAEGNKVHMQCPPTLLWDSYLQTCNYPDKTDCGHTVGPTGVPTAPTPPKPPTAGPTARPTPPPAPTGPTARPTGPSAPTAPPAPPTSRPTDAPLGRLCLGQIDGEILPYPQDCSRYVQCIGGEEFYYKCPRDTYFDRSTAACTSASSDRC